MTEERNEGRKNEREGRKEGIEIETEEGKEKR